MPACSVPFLDLPAYPEAPAKLPSALIDRQYYTELMQFASPELKSTYSALDWTDREYTGLSAYHYTVADIQLQDTEKWADVSGRELSMRLAEGERELAAKKDVIGVKEMHLEEQGNVLDAQMMRVREAAISVAYDRCQLALLTAEHQAVSASADGLKRRAQQTVDNLRHTTLISGKGLPNNIRQLLRDGTRVGFVDIGGKRARFWKDVHVVSISDHALMGSAGSVHCDLLDRPHLALQCIIMCTS